MFSLLRTRGVTASLTTPIATRTIGQTIQNTTKRTFTSITPLRPTLSSFRPASLSLNTTSQIPIEESTDLCLFPDKLAISAHPAFAGLGSQIRCARRDTFDPSHFVRKRRHGFLSRIRTRKGRNTLKRRKLKGRNTLSH